MAGKQLQLTLDRSAFLTCKRLGNAKISFNLLLLALTLAFDSSEASATVKLQDRAEFSIEFPLLQKIL